MNHIIKGLTQIFKQFTGSYQITDGHFCLNYGPGNCKVHLDHFKTPEYWPKFLKALELAAGRFTGPDITGMFELPAPDQAAPLYTKTKQFVWLSHDCYAAAETVDKTSVKAQIVTVPGLENYTFILTPGKNCPLRILYKGLTFTMTHNLGVDRAQFIADFIGKCLEFEQTGKLAENVEKNYTEAMKKKKADQAPEIGAPVPVKTPAKPEALPVVPVTKVKGLGPIREHLESPENQIDFWEWDVKAMHRQIEDGKETLNLAVEGFYYQGSLKIIQTGPELFEVQMFGTGEVLEFTKAKLVPGLSKIIQTGKRPEAYRKKLIEYFEGMKK